jgi:hypothetical protein
MLKFSNCLLFVIFSLPPPSFLPLIVLNKKMKTTLHCAIRSESFFNRHTHSEVRKRLCILIFRYLEMVAEHSIPCMGNPVVAVAAQ